jgi:hypothetical protein
MVNRRACQANLERFANTAASVRIIRLDDGSYVLTRTDTKPFYYYGRCLSDTVDPRGPTGK